MKNTRSSIPFFSLPRIIQIKNYARFQLGSLKPLTAEKTEVSLNYPCPLNPSHRQDASTAFFRQHNVTVLQATNGKYHWINFLHLSTPFVLDKYSPSFCCSDHCSPKMGFGLGWAYQSCVCAYCCYNIYSSVTSTFCSPSVNPRDEGVPVWKGETREAHRKEEKWRKVILQTNMFISRLW